MQLSTSKIAIAFNNCGSLSALEMLVNLGTLYYGDFPLITMVRYK